MTLSGLLTGLADTHESNIKTGEGLWLRGSQETGRSGFGRLNDPTADTGIALRCVAVTVFLGVIPRDEGVAPLLDTHTIR
jgi:hypothetical protein